MGLKAWVESAEKAFWANGAPESDDGGKGVFVCLSSGMGNQEFHLLTWS